MKRLLLALTTLSIGIAHAQAPSPTDAIPRTERVGPAEMPKHPEYEHALELLRNDPAVMAKMFVTPGDTFEPGRLDIEGRLGTFVELTRLHYGVPVPDDKLRFRFDVEGRMTRDDCWMTRPIGLPPPAPKITEQEAKEFAMTQSSFRYPVPSDYVKMVVYTGTNAAAPAYAWQVDIEDPHDESDEGKCSRTFVSIDTLALVAKEEGGCRVT